MFDFAKELARAYDARTLEYQGRRAQPNFPQDALSASQIVHPNMRIVSKAEEQEHLKAEALIRARERLSTDRLVERYLREDQHLYAINEALLMTARNQKDVEDARQTGMISLRSPTRMTMTTSALMLT